MQAPLVPTSTTNESLYESHMAALRNAHARQAATAAFSALSRGHAYSTPQRVGGTSAGGGGGGRVSAHGAGRPKAVAAAPPTLPAPPSPGPSHAAPNSNAVSRGEERSRPASGSGRPSPQLGTQPQPAADGIGPGSEDVRQGGFYSPMSTPRAVSSEGGAVSPMSIPEGEEASLVTGVPFNFSPRASAGAADVRPRSVSGGHSNSRPGPGGSGSAAPGRAPVRADHSIANVRAALVASPIPQQHQSLPSRRSVSRGRSVGGGSQPAVPRSRGTSVGSRGGASGANATGVSIEQTVPARVVTIAQAEAFYSRQTGWLRAKHEHEDRERAQRLKSLATAPGPGGGKQGPGRRSGSAKPKLVSTADAEAFFASEVACKQRREETLEKRREEARLKKAAQEAAELAECTFVPNAARRAAEAAAAASASHRSQAQPVGCVPYTPSARVLHLLTTRDRGSHSRVDPGPDPRSAARASFSAWAGGEDGLRRAGAPGTAPGSSQRSRSSSVGGARRGHGSNGHAQALDGSAVRRSFGQEAPPSPISSGSVARAGSSSPVPDQPAFDVDACLVDFERCLEAVLTSTSPVRKSSPNPRDRHRHAPRTPHRRR